MKIYFATSIRGGRDNSRVSSQIVAYLKKFGEVLTEHISDANLSILGEPNKSDRSIHDRDLEWILSSDVVMAEVSTPSLGVGYEIGRALEHHKKVLCLYHPQEGKRLSAMIAGCPDIELHEYHSLDHAEKILDDFFRNIKLC